MKVLSSLVPESERNKQNAPANNGNDNNQNANGNNQNQNNK